MFEPVVVASLNRRLMRFMRAVSLNQ